MYYDVVIAGNSYSILDEKQLEIKMTRGSNILSYYNAQVALPSRMDNLLELTLVFYKNLELIKFFETKSDIQYKNDFAFTNFKFDVSLYKYEMLEDHYSLDYGDLLLEEIQLYGCFVESTEMSYDLDYTNAKLRFDYLDITNYFKGEEND